MRLLLFVWLVPLENIPMLVQFRVLRVQLEHTLIQLVHLRVLCVHLARIRQLSPQLR
jgi:hypothetical protein